MFRSLGSSDFRAMGLGFWAKRLGFWQMPDVTESDLGDRQATLSSGWVQVLGSMVTPRP